MARLFVGPSIGPSLGLSVRQQTRALVGLLISVLIGLLLLPATVHAATPFGGLLTIDGAPAPNAPPLDDGKWTLVMIWATDCEICRAQKPAISAFHDAHRDKDATVVGVAMDGQGRDALATVRATLAAHPVSFPNVVADPLQLAGDFANLVEEPLRGTPTYLLFGPDGEIRGVNPGALTIDALERFIAR